MKALVDDLKLKITTIIQGVYLYLLKLSCYDGGCFSRFLSIFPFLVAWRFIMLREGILVVSSSFPRGSY